MKCYWRLIAEQEGGLGCLRKRYDECQLKVLHPDDHVTALKEVNINNAATIVREDNITSTIRNIADVIGVDV